MKLERISEICMKNDVSLNLRTISMFQITITLWGKGTEIIHAIGCKNIWVILSEIMKRNVI